MTYLRKYTREQLIALARERGIHPPESATDEELKRVERRLSAERGWICEPQPARHGVEEWAARHRALGHHPHPAPTSENPEQWECKCDLDAIWTAVWGILTIEQVRRKFAHLTAANRRAEEKAKKDARRRLRAKLWPTDPPVPAQRRELPSLQIAARYATGRKEGATQWRGYATRATRRPRWDTPSR